MGSPSGGDPVPQRAQRRDVTPPVGDLERHARGRGGLGRGGGLRHGQPARLLAQDRQPPRGDLGDDRQVLVARHHDQDPVDSGAVQRVMSAAMPLVMTLNDVLFDTGQATLKAGADRALDRLAQFLKDSPGTHVIIEGHTDSVGTDDYNLGLSQRRAQAVADALRSRGVSTDRTETKGLGKAYPVASNDTQAGRQQIRRVEIIFSDESGRFAQTSP